MDEEQKKAKESMKIMAKIAYKEWKERKTEESRHKKKVDKMEKRRERMEQQEIKMARRQMVMEMQRRQGGGGQILLAYGLNKNLKQLERAKSAKPRRSQQQYWAQKGQTDFKSTFNTKIGQWISKQWDNWWGKEDKNQLINFWVACDYNGTNKKETNGAIYD